MLRLIGSLSGSLRRLRANEGTKSLSIASRLALVVPEVTISALKTQN